MRRNIAVEYAYCAIEQNAKLLLTTIERDELRCILTRDRTSVTPGSVIHELVSPLLYLRMQHEENGEMTIRFGIEPVTGEPHLEAITSQFLRIVFRETSRSAKVPNIEECVRTDWFVNSCAEVYEYVELRDEHHILSKLPYKPKEAKRLLSLA